MKSALALGTSVLLLAALPAAAASYPGQDVSVNQGALGSGYLLYPGGKYGRFVPHLLQPGEKPARVIHLHMPRKVTVVRPRAPKPAAPADIATATPPPAPVESTPPPPKPRVARTTPPASTPPASAPTPDISAMPENSASRLVGATATPPAIRPRRAAPAAGGAAAFAATIASTPPPPKTLATAAPPPTPPATPSPADDTAGMNRQSVIPFAAGSSTPAASDINAIHGLAGKLTAALGAGASRVQLQAYGGPRGDKSSDSRRLSLKRALVIRELLIEDGVPSEKIDVRAMGGVDDNSAPDRVDIFLRS